MDWRDSRVVPSTHVISNAGYARCIALQRLSPAHIQRAMCACSINNGLDHCTEIEHEHLNNSIECCNRACDYTIVLYVVNTCQVTLTATHFLTTLRNGCEFAIEIGIWLSGTSVMGGCAKATSDQKLIFYCCDRAHYEWIHFPLFASSWISNVERIR